MSSLRKVMRLDQRDAEASYRGVQRHTQTCGASTNNDQIECVLLSEATHQVGTDGRQRGVLWSWWDCIHAHRYPLVGFIPAPPGAGRQCNGRKATELPAGSGAQRTLPSFHACSSLP